MLHFYFYSHVFHSIIRCYIFTTRCYIKQLDATFSFLQPVLSSYNLRLHFYNQVFHSTIRCYISRTRCYKEHSKENTVPRSRNMVHSIQYTVHSTLYTVQRTQHTVHSIQCKVHSTQYIAYSSHFAILQFQSNPYTV